MSIPASELTLTQSRHSVQDMFYATIIALALVQNAAAEGPKKKRSSFRPPKPAQSPWHRFLDELCNLCQAHKADAVVSIAVEIGGVFWIALASGNKNQASGHLSKVLKELKTFAALGPGVDKARLEATVNTIARISIERSAERVAWYVHELQEIAGQGDDFGPSSQDEERCLEMLQQLQQPFEYHYDLCRMAYDFGPTSAHEVLREKISTSKDDKWNNIRHCIGRLGSWHRAARFVASSAHLFNDRLRECSIKPVKGPRKFKTEDRIRVDTDPRRLLEQLYPRYQDFDMLDFAADKMTASKLLRKFRDEDQIPKVHPEAWMLYHFRSNGMSFFENDAYIGCSKPSCYCCDALFNKDINVTRRPTHGKAYLRWALPCDDANSIKILRHMTNDAQDKVMMNIRQKEFGNVPIFDSTTGMSASRRILREMLRS